MDMLELANEIGLAYALLAAVATWCVMRVLHPLAPRLNLLDFPVGRKDHAHPTPIIGGLAMVVGCIVVLPLIREHATATMLSFVAASLLLVGIGLYDDRYDLRWYWRVLAQVVAALIMIYGAGVSVANLGGVFGMGELGWISVPFTVFATVGIINAINMVDGADGLAGSLVAACLVMLACAAVYAGNPSLARISLVIAGAVCAFLLYNMRFPWQPRAKTFMGNAGSAWLGLLVAWVVFRLTQNSGHPVNPVLALWLLPIPVLDCLVLTVRRVREGRSPFSAGRDHIHHFMQDAGFGPTQAALVLTLFSLGTGLVAGQLMRLDVPNMLILAGFLALCLGWYALSTHRQRTLRFFAVLRALPVFGPMPERAHKARGRSEVPLPMVPGAGKHAAGSRSAGTTARRTARAVGKDGAAPAMAQSDADARADDPVNDVDPSNRHASARERLRNSA
ncbi:MraY family glycosyltransferase [Luteimonas sp. MC1750]|uniref:MraY family glycosyltransferase n=1 Tax=Luteimonas sp. MC1750 TaxID=2799326 RepID=UPI0018F0E728|nr:MraY family glycosyltransferase [Luteimonas sp. MC1750]MBJ6984187.1 undecaprenyl/decaprenyl-phosphate alpha-N-acetylglucosaminyl 1-phosphate transferase [Luteimonas sp. MC1750]QQO07025.1 undecaprenyl/decaprenyl-phosphate alpha-N-acetylglucosaminyl 1-phosphate transferase [Luteimonas sp. MC1750]